MFKLKRTETQLEIQLEDIEIDQTIGGTDFDIILLNYLIENFDKAHGLSGNAQNVTINLKVIGEHSIRSSPRAVAKLLLQVRQVKVKTEKLLRNF